MEWRHSLGLFLTHRIMSWTARQVEGQDPGHLVMGLKLPPQPLYAGMQPWSGLAPTCRISRCCILRSTHPVKIILSTALKEPEGPPISISRIYIYIPSLACRFI